MAEGGVALQGLQWSHAVTPKLFARSDSMVNRKTAEKPKRTCMFFFFPCSVHPNFGPAASEVRQKVEFCPSRSCFEVRTDDGTWFSESASINRAWEVMEPVVLWGYGLRSGPVVAHTAIVLEVDSSAIVLRPRMRNHGVDGAFQTLNEFAEVTLLQLKRSMGGNNFVLKILSASVKWVLFHLERIEGSNFYLKILTAISEEFEDGNVNFERMGMSLTAIVQALQEFEDDKNLFAKEKKSKILEAVVEEIEDGNGNPFKLEWIGDRYRNNNDNRNFHLKVVNAIVEEIEDGNSKHVKLERMGYNRKVYLKILTTFLNEVWDCLCGTGTLIQLERMGDNNVYLKILTKASFWKLEKQELKLSRSGKILGDAVRRAVELCQTEDYDFALSNCQKATKEVKEYLKLHEFEREPV